MEHEHDPDHLRITVGLDAETIRLIQSFRNASAIERTLMGMLHSLNTLNKKVDEIMTIRPALQAFLDKDAAFKTALSTTVDDLVGDVTDLAKQIADLKNSITDLSDEEKAALDAASASADAVLKKATDLDALTPPPVPPASALA